ncbi:adenylate/guanylate cyclase domain-containing protein [Enhygromyxa salina]|uniref:Adenylate and Guanylate cyclase catalytic domain protein n=1 Tax=Enhygromyxa salina TaxID=215803 RepID=A0A2S9YNK0_9BACT|nr:adenylate/guanylate cyclase domain-containing protein [Enhygromyxa salina]PRQ06665.1 Adenylate and Guanylate cyclase catalytic domain protein [Enhygromyxa salina]
MAAPSVSPEQLTAFLERFAWPEHMLAGGRAPLEFLWRFEVDAPIASMWPLLIDTSRFNRALGLTEMNYEERDGRLHGTVINGGFRQTWVEVPWQWIHGHHMEAVRDYSEGFGRWVRAIYEVTEVRESSFELLVYFGWIPRGWLGEKILAFAFPKLGEDYGRLLAELATAARQAKVSPRFEVSRPSLDEASEARLAVGVRELISAELPAPLVRQLAAHLRSADDLDLARIQPKVLARRWGADTRTLLRVALHATRVGLLDLSWDIVCPHCRGTREEHASLSRVPGESRCEVCEIDFDTRSEVSVEVSFRVNPAIRKVGLHAWCAAEPSHREHILVQLRLAPDERRRVTLTVGEGLFRLRGSEGATTMLDLSPAADPAPLAWTPTNSGGEHSRAPRPILELHNDRDQPIDFVLERARWSDEAVRPGDLLSLREFRDIFSADYLAADVQLAVGMQTLLFTDMVGSTRFYATRGDAEAFVQVRRHFAEIFEVVAAQDGVVVKTIGDAVMAAFVDAASAVRAAHAIQRRFPASREDLDIRVRVSLNRGSCIAVRFNTEIDYFGNAVNLAAKLQGSAGAGQVTFSTAVRDAPGVVEVLGELGVEIESLTVDLPALGGEIEVLRWTDEDGVDPASSLAMPVARG